MDFMVRAPWPYYSSEEVAAVNRVLESGKVNYWTGEQGRLFEREFAEYCGSKYAVAVANGTLALELALRSLRIGPGDEVITASRTFIASASCIVACGATPIFADVDPNSQNITANTIKSVLSSHTKAIIVVHLAGWPCDMDPIMELAAEYDLRVIEDCAQAHGARYKGRPVGSLADVAAFSFCQDKIMSTGGEGGMLVTSSVDLWQIAWAYKDHGKNYDKVYHQAHPPGFRWLHDTFGSNFRMTEMQAAIGREQLKKLDEWLAKRRENANKLSCMLDSFPCVRLPGPENDIVHAYYKFYFFVQPDQLKSDWTRERIVAEICVSGVPCFTGSCSEIYLEQAFTSEGLGPDSRCSVAQCLGDDSVMLLVHPTINEELMQAMINNVRSVLTLAQKDLS